MAQKLSKQIVFILNDIQQARSLKRIEEFQAQGYKVKVYGFERPQSLGDRQVPFERHTIAVIDNTTSYRSRVWTMYAAIRKVVRENKSSTFYLFGLAVAAFAKFANPSIRYFYEESDLVHTYINNKLVRGFMERLDKRIVRKSMETVFTSEGFALFHFGNKYPDNCSFITNRLHKSILELPFVKKTQRDMNHLRIAFVGAARFKSIEHVAEYILSHHPEHEFHFYGNMSKEIEDMCARYDTGRCVIHGRFVTPDDLPRIYSNIDLLVSTYDTEFENVRYAEPNKLYEAVYFETPIIVSDNTFLAEKVARLGIGFSIDPLDDDSIERFLSGLTDERLDDIVANASKIDKMEAVNVNTKFFEKIAPLFS